jgi:uncharacterized protein (DUF1810 family)
MEREQAMELNAEPGAEHDPHNLRRFVEAQEPVYEQVRAELQAGSKASHWMWFVFPQLKGLGRSPTAEYFGIASHDEAVAYWTHPLLGPRLRECTDLVLAVEGRTAHQIFGSPDDVKFRSCLTLFERAAPEEPVFARALDKYFEGERDAATLEFLG